MSENGKTPEKGRSRALKDFLFPNWRERDKDYNKFFFRSIRWVSWLFMVIGVVSSVIIFYSTGDIFRTIAVFFILVWLVIFLRYFLWAVYHYNIN